MKKKSLAFATHILESLGLVVEDDARISILDENGAKPIVCDGKAWVLPTDDILRDSNWDELQAFAPLGENPLRGESQVFRTLLAVTKTQLNIRIAELLWRLVVLVTNDQREKIEEKMNPVQSELLSVLIGIDDKMCHALRSVITSLNPKNFDTTFVDLNIKRKGKVNNVQFQRVCNVLFPLADIDPSDKKVFGVTMRVKDVNALLALFEYILPQSTTLPGAYSFGTDSPVAPNLVALLNSYNLIQTRLNEVADIFKDDFENINFSGVVAKTDFMKYLGNLEKLRDELPILMGNEGVVPRGGVSGNDVKLAAPKQAPAVAKIGVADAVESVRQPANMVEKEEVSLPWEESKSSTHQPVPQQVQQPQARQTQSVDSDTISYEEYEARRRAAQPQHQQTLYGGYQPEPPQQRMTIQQYYNGGYNPQMTAHTPQYDVGNSPYSTDHRPADLQNGQRPSASSLLNRHGQSRTGGGW